MGTSFDPQRLTPWGPDRLELGEGGRWVGDRVALVDIPTGRLLESDPSKPGPLHQLAGLDLEYSPLKAGAEMRKDPHGDGEEARAALTSRTTAIHSPAMRTT